MRTPLQGTLNVARFNWPYYAAAGAGAVLAAAGGRLVPNRRFALAKPLRGILKLGLFAGGVATLNSLLATYCVYDGSGYYDLDWLDHVPTPRRVLNVNAGFDELTGLLRVRYPAAEVVPVDFYDPETHTEASIARARAAYPPPPDTVALGRPAHVSRLAPANLIVAALSAHEIRDAAERADFFARLRARLLPGGRIVLVEHVRDLANALAYSVGVGHFHTRAEWQATFDGAGLRVVDERRHTPFLRVITLAA